jgi:hypothetical protein
VDLVQNEYFLLRLVNEFLWRKKFSSDGELKYAVYFWCDAEEFDSCSKGSKPLEQESNRSVAMDSVYKEKCSKLPLRGRGHAQISC